MRKYIRLHEILQLVAKGTGLFLLVLIIMAGCAGTPESARSSELDGSDVVVTTDSTDDTPEAPEERSDGDAKTDRSSGEAPAGAASDASAPLPSPEPSLATESAPGGRGARSEGTGGPEFVTSDYAGESGLSAGFADDNEQYGYFVEFLDEYIWVDHLDLDISERIMLHVRDVNGDSVPNATISISKAGTRTGSGAGSGTGTGTESIESGVTLADGTYQFNPSLYSDGFDRYTVRIEGSAGSAQVEFFRDGNRTVEIDFQDVRELPQRIPVDIVFALDTTGSMGEEIDRLKKTIELIHLNLDSMAVPTTIRFGLVLYKDVGDTYRTRTVPLTANLREFQTQLNDVRASGGGDTPEDLQAALEETVGGMNWNEDGLRLSFIVTDAPPHLDYAQSYDYTVAARNAREAGIKIFSVGTGGLDVQGEYVLRQIAQFTGGAYIFLTYGEEGESEGGAPGSVSHHTGSNFQTDKLETIIIRLAKEELSFLTDAPIEAPENYFTARKLDSEDRERTLLLLFGQAVEQLADFSTIALSRDTTIAVLPITTGTPEIAADAEYFTEQLILAASRSERMALVERTNLQELLEEQKLQLSGLTDSQTVTKIGEIMNAQILVISVLYSRDSYELFLKLARVETGEILSVTKAVIDRELGVTKGPE